MSSPERRTPSLQRRLALGVLAALGLMLVLLTLVLDELVDRELHAYMDDGLHKRAGAIVTFIQTQPERIDLLSGLMTEYQRSSHTDFFQVWDEQGEVLLRSASSAKHTLMRPATWPVTKPVYYNQVLPDGHEGRALAQSFDAIMDGRTVRLTLVVASERAFEDRLETVIDYVLGVGVLLGLVLALIVALWAVRRGLAPVLRVGERMAHRDDSGLPAADALKGVLLPRELQPFAQALDDAFARLHAAIERERRFSSDVAHELRTPLAEIRAAIEVAARAPGDTQATQAAFAASLGAVERMQRAIDTLLLLARYEAGLTTPAPDPLDLPALLDALLDAQAPLAAQRGITLERAYRNGKGTWVRSDIGALERIVSNLLGNAIAYAPEGSSVDVCVQQCGDGGGVVLSVGNLAPDLTAADLAYLGQRFWRKSSAGGTAAHAGLGLALALALAHSLGLRIDFKLTDGRLSVRVLGLAQL
ncbi:MAG: sensor histidine kinase [Burkholderiaceae bacterium]|jgi:two-component system sensor histidine kinase QseC|nr:sensor histidine kinase [Burkholderiaceae bacterium]